ncbi:serine O-acetyltransferase EpsC [Cesiribacter andamanensis]|uniref:Serine acetyltransferase n=1 Tax=Cesiribacter andamanensis AMV16 TaxID=1279009 RepID=M7P195_9BACT|nr:serine O-acetyltransferase EpsC [Cesiribacter andamanensis]EMR04369.1 Serine acetyltransferase [Cesiribacter andamanensis AMV16]
MTEKEFIQELFQRNYHAFKGFPSKKKAEEFIDRLFLLLFAPCHGRFRQEQELEAEYQDLKDLGTQLLRGAYQHEELRQELVDQLFAGLPRLYQRLLLDARAILASDPAARSLEEVLLAYPGFYATAIYRLSHALWLEGVPILPRLFSEYAHRLTGIDIHPGATIGDAFAIDHGTGIVIGETAVIGKGVKIYQGVTLGALQVDKGYAGQKRHPTIEDEVVIYSGATILGGTTTIGRNSIIGGNVWLTSGVPPHSVVYHKSEVKVRDNNPFPEPINFVI